MAKKDWKGKTTNLSKKEVQSGRRIVGGSRRTEKVTGAERKSSRKAVDISGTKWQTAKERGGKGVGGLLTDASGKAITGTVTLPSGKKAVYVRGKRVQAQKATPRGGGGGGTPPKPLPKDYRKHDTNQGKMPKNPPAKPNYEGKLKNMPNERGPAGMRKNPLIKDYRIGNTAVPNRNRGRFQPSGKIGGR